MANTQTPQRRADPLGSIEDWMESRRADLERMGARAEAAGRDAWANSTQTGSPLVAAQPSDVIALGDRSLRAQAASSSESMASPRVAEPEPPAEIEGPIQAAARPTFEVPRRMDLGFRVVQAQPGDSISRLVGVSDPRAIGRFQTLNGMNDGRSNLSAGHSYFVPTNWNDAGADETAAGRRTLQSDNARLADVARRTAEGFRQTQRLADGRNVWTGERIEAANPLPMPVAPSRRTWLDGSKAAKLVGGALAYEAGLGPGVARGAWNTLKGAAEGAYFVKRMNDPLDLIFSPPGQSALAQVFKAGKAGANLAKRDFDNPSLLGDDIARGFHEFRQQNDPTATPMADTLGGELRRNFNFGLNHGEMGFDAASLLVGGEALRGAAGVGAVAKAADATELAYLAKNPGLEAYFDQPYSGMGHHIWGRNQPLPSWLGGGLVPKVAMESPFNKIRDADMTKRDFFRNHVGADEDYWGGYMGRKFGRSGWSGKDLGWDDYGALDRLNYGTSPATKAVVGAGLFGGTSSDLLRRGANP